MSCFGTDITDPPFCWTFLRIMRSGAVRTSLYYFLLNAPSALWEVPTHKQIQSSHVSGSGKLAKPFVIRPVSYFETRQNIQKWIAFPIFIFQNTNEKILRITHVEYTRTWDYRRLTYWIDFMTWLILLADCQNEFNLKREKNKLI